MLAALATIVAGAAGAHEVADDAVVAWLRDGESRLAAGDTDAATASFERAAATRHSAAVEVSAVRAGLQAGQYRSALAFAAHAASAHPDEFDGTAVYVWLLHIGGQQRVARRVLDAALARAPRSPLLLAVNDGLQGWPDAHGLLMTPPVRLAPYANVEPSPARILATATLFDGGRRALAPAEALAGTTGNLWLRNGLGRTVRASLSGRVDIAGIEIAVLELVEPLAAPASTTAAARAPYAGSAGYAVEYAPVAGSAPPGWPVMHVGFFGRSANSGGATRLGIDTPAGPRGGPVFDAAGRFAGIAARDRAGIDRLVPAGALSAALRESIPATPAVASAFVAPDAIYEQSLTIALQVIAEDTRGAPRNRITGD